MYDTLYKALIAQKHLQIVRIQTDFKASGLLSMPHRFILLTVDFNSCYFWVLIINYDSFSFIFISLVLLYLYEVIPVSVNKSFVYNFPLTVF